MKRTCVSACALVVAASLAGCMGTGEVEYAGEVRVTSPELIQVSPGVMVLADADEPLFYSRGYYWLYREGYWFRSDTYRTGFARIDFTYVPAEIRVIDRPQLYVQYRRHMGRYHHARTPQTQVRTPTPPPVQHQQPTVPSQTPPYPPPGRAKDEGVTGDPDRDKHEHTPPQDRSDRATPPGQTHTDDRTKKPDNKKDQKKNEKY